MNLFRASRPTTKRSPISFLFPNKMLKKSLFHSPALRRLHPPALSLPRHPLCPGTSIILGGAPSSLRGSTFRGLLATYLSRGSQEVPCFALPTLYNADSLERMMRSTALTLRIHAVG